MLSLSLIEPPGWTTAEIPSFPAISTQSGKGKNASEAITAPLRSKPKAFAFSMACFNASTLLVWPTPLENSWSWLLRIMVFDLVCLQIFKAKTKASLDPCPAQQSHSIMF